MFTDPYQQTYQYPRYAVSTPYFSQPGYGFHMPRESTRGHPEREKDRRRSGHSSSQKPSHEQSYTREAERPVDGRYFHVEGVQIVDADKLREAEEREKEERRRSEQREESSPPKGTWESTDYSRKVSYRHNSGQHRDRHTYDHRRTTRVYQTNPVESAAHPSQKYLVRKEEWTSTVKEYEMYQSAKWPSASRDQRSRTTRPDAQGYQGGKGHRAKD